MRTRNSKRVQYDRHIGGSIAVKTWDKMLSIFVTRYVIPAPNKPIIIGGRMAA